MLKCSARGLNETIFFRRGLDNLHSPNYFAAKFHPLVTLHYAKI